MDNDKPYKRPEEFNKETSDSSQEITLTYKPDLVILCNPSNSRNFFVSFDAAARENRGLLVGPGEVRQVKVRCRSIHVINDGGSDMFHGMALSRKREKW